MPIYKGTTELTKIADFLTATERDITEVYFGDKQVFTVWATYDGTLPAQYSTNGSTLVDYRVYGSAGGVGDKTENIYNKNATNTSNGYVNNAYLNPQGSIITFNPQLNSHWQISEYINVSPSTPYYQKAMGIHMSPCLCEYDISYNFLKSTSFDSNDHITITTTEQTAFVRLSVWDTQISNTVTFTEGSTAPAEYVPYGYEVDMSVSDGTTSTTVPIYIGSDPLGEDEYVDYGERKVYRRPNLLNMNTLEPGYLATDGAVHTPSSASMVTDYMEVTLGTYILSVSRTNNLYSQNARYVNYYNTNKEYLGYSSYTPSPVLKDTSHAFTISNPNIKYAKITLDVSYTKAVFRIKNPAPTDPPVPLPALPTVDGTNIVDYAGQSAAVPSRFVAKYRKENF